MARKRAKDQPKRRNTPQDDGPLTEKQLAAICRISPQEGYKPTRSLIEGALTFIKNKQAIDAAMISVATLKKQLVDTGLLITGADLAARLGVSVQALHKGQGTGRYFALELGGHRDYYPAFFADPQIRNNGLYKVLKVLHGFGAWTKWTFLTTPMVPLKGRTPIEALKEGRDLKTVLALARAEAEG